MPVTARAEAQGNERAKRYFLWSLLAATSVPIGFFILVAPSHGTMAGIAGMKTVFLFLGTAHVPATLYFYTDKQFSGIINPQHHL
ncbi:MAG TPA: hypothetical protein VIF81_12215 [Pyrinomonadaceae bacterium]